MRIPKPSPRQLRVLRRHLYVPPCELCQEDLWQGRGLRIHCSTFTEWHFRRALGFNADRDREDLVQYSLVVGACGQQHNVRSHHPAYPPPAHDSAFPEPHDRQLPQLALV
jgi:hypothetical protein